MNNRKIILALPDAELDRAVKIQGTQFDRKRKLNDKDIVKAANLISSGKSSIEEVATMFSVDPRTIRSYIDPAYRANVNKSNREWYSKTHYNGHTLEDLKNSTLSRITYKRKLVKRRKIKV